MKIRTALMLKLLYILSWIIFIGVCIEAGGFIFNAIFTLILNPADAKHLWQQVDLSGLYNYDHGQFLVEMFLISLVAVLRAILFYMIVKILHDKKLDMAQPFNAEMGKFLLNISYVTLAIGLFSYWGVNYAEWLSKQGIKMPDVQSLRLAGADVWLFMSVTLFVIAQIFKRGIELQTENDLTI